MSELNSSQPQQLSIEGKKKKIQSNYETVEVLRSRLNDGKNKQKLGMTRAAYIKMILDVTKKVERQNDELNRAIMDTRRLQRDIGHLGGRLERSFKLVEDNIVRDIKHDGWSRECYRLLNVMHENCDQLIRAVQDTGELTREMRQLEDQVGRMRVAKAIVDL